MKGSVPRITLLGSNSGRNVGDAAILASVMDVLKQEMPDVEFFVPSSNPSFVEKHYASTYKVKGVSFMPWTASVRMIGLTTFSCIAKSDAALICDGIIFGKKLWNPFFNWLIQLIFVAPWAKLMGCKMVCYSCGIGPFQSAASRWMAKTVLNLCDLVIMREQDSKTLAEKIGVTRPIHVTGDAAFLNQVSDDSRVAEIAREQNVDMSRPLLGVNINSYFDAWLGKGEKLSSADFISSIAASIVEGQKLTNNAYTPLLFSTHPMDEPVVRELADRLKAPVIANSTYLSHDMQAMMRRCELFLGMRFHSLVLASAVNVPVVGLIYMQKVRGFMKDLGCADYGVELSNISPQSLGATIARAWNDRAILASRQRAVIDELKVGARRAATMVKDLIGGAREPVRAERDMNASVKA